MARESVRESNEQCGPVMEPRRAGKACKNMTPTVDDDVTSNPKHTRAADSARVWR